MTTLKPGYGSYRGHPYRIRSRGRRNFIMWAVEVEGEVMTTWHFDIHAAVAEFKAGVDDILD